MCPMSAMIDSDSLIEMKSKHPKADSVAYVNTSARVKAEVDICCTSSNAIKVVASLTSKEVIFVPDANLGYWVQRTEKQKKLILWLGFCPTHDSITPEMILTQNVSIEGLGACTPRMPPGGAGYGRCGPLH